MTILFYSTYPRLTQLLRRYTGIPSNRNDPRAHPWDEKVYLQYLHEWWIFMVNVGKYTTYMDAMGMGFPEILKMQHFY